MDDGLNLKKVGMVPRMAKHPMGAFLGGLVAAGLCGGLGYIEGSTVAAAMAILGAVVGAPLGAVLASSAHLES